MDHYLYTILFFIILIPIITSVNFLKNSRLTCSMFIGPYILNILWCNRINFLVIVVYMLIDVDHEDVVRKMRTVVEIVHEIQYVIVTKYLKNRYHHYTTVWFVPIVLWRYFNFSLTRRILSSHTDEYVLKIWALLLINSPKYEKFNFASRTRFWM